MVCETRLSILESKTLFNIGEVDLFFFYTEFKSQMYDKDIFVAAI